MKTLVVYYSHSGNTRLVAQEIAKTTRADVLELRPKKELASEGFDKFLWGGAQVIMKKAPPLLPFDVSPQDYDLIIIGTPVWVRTYAPPLRTFFSTTDLEDKRVALFCCCAGGKGNTLQDMKAALPGNSFVGEIDYVDPAETEPAASLQRASEWAGDIQAALSQ